MFGETIKRCLFEIKCRSRHPDWWRSYGEALSHERMSRDELAEFNFRLRLDVLRFAYENCSYYKGIYDSAGLHPGDVKTEEDWSRVPILTRDELRTNFDGLKINGLKERGGYRQFLTGGTTGTPSKVIKDTLFCSRGLNFRAMDWAGISQGQNQATVMRAHPSTVKERLFSYLAHFPSRNIFLDASEITDASVSRFVKEWLQNPPVSVTAYAGGMQQVALYCQKRGITLPSPKAIFTTASPIDLVQRKFLHGVFGAPIFDSYVATEANPMAGQCRCCAEADNPALHIHSDFRHLEFVDPHGFPMPIGEEGDVLVTDLGDRAFPIIRYRIGDRGRALSGNCDCGRPFPLMDAVRGRMAYRIYLEKGVLTGGWTTIFDKYPNAVHGFQIHQFADKSVTLSVILNKNNSNATYEVEAVAANMRKKLGVLPLRIEYVESIPHDRGKLKYIICDIKE
jgi:phenylacetate-CoA ligase